MMLSVMLQCRTAILYNVIMQDITDTVFDTK